MTFIYVLPNACTEPELQRSKDDSGSSVTTNAEKASGVP